MTSNYTTEDYCVALLGMAETFRTRNPPQIRKSIQCLQALFNFSLAPNLSMVAHFQLGKILHHYTRNTDLARAHLEGAYQVAQTLVGFEEIRVQIGSLLGQIYFEQKQLPYCKNTLREVLDISSPFHFWHCRLLLQSAEAYIYEKNFPSACQLLDVGAVFCSTMQVVYTEALFRLSKAMLLLNDRNSLEEVHGILKKVKELIQSVPGTNSRKECLKAFFMAVQVCYMLMLGKVKGAKDCLKQLQHCIQVVTSAPPSEDGDMAQKSPIEHFEWLSKDLLCIFVYVVTVVHSMEGGQVDRAQKYAEKALSQIEKLRTLSRPEDVELLNSFHVLILESSVMQRLIIGQPSLAIREISQICRLSSHSQTLFTTHEAQTHTLLGLYAMSMRETELAEKQFGTALRVAKDVDLWCYVNLNLAVMYLQSGRDQDFYLLLERITPDRLPSSSKSLQAAAYFVRGLQAFFHNRNQEAKRYLKDGLAVSNEEDLSRISAATLVLLGNICLKYQNIQDCSSMLQPALELSNRIPDLTLQMWGTLLLKEVYTLCEDKKKSDEAQQVHDSYAARYEKDLSKAKALTEHSLINWSEGPCLHFSSTDS